MRTFISLLFLSLVLCLALPARAAEPVVVPRPRMVADFMNAEANRLLDRRDAEITAIDTADEVRERQRRMRTWFAEKLGPMPPKAERPPRITGEIDCDEVIRKLKQLVADLSLDKKMLQDVLSKKL